MPSSIDPSIPTPDDVRLDVHGNVPPALSGRMVGIDRDGTVHSVETRGRRVSYRSRLLRTDDVLRHVVAFGGTILACGVDSPAYELSRDLDTLRRVDLAGQARVLAVHPRHDPVTRELHLVARAADGGQAHVVVSAGALTRHNRPLLDTPCRIEGLALTRDHVVLLADGCVGVAAREGAALTTWIATHVAAPHPVHAHESGDNVVLTALTPSLERWTMHAGSGITQRDVLDETPWRAAHVVDVVDGVPRFVWTTGDTTTGQHDLADPLHARHSTRRHSPGDFVMVPDVTRSAIADGGWLVGFVQDASGTSSELRVVDAADIAGPAIATARLPRPIPRGLRCAWIPSVEP